MDSSGAESSSTAEQASSNGNTSSSATEQILQLYGYNGDKVLYTDSKGHRYLMNSKSSTGAMILLIRVKPNSENSQMFTDFSGARSKRVELFVQAADARLQKNLVQLLEDAASKLDLTSDWKLVPDVVNMIVKCQMQMDKLIVVVSSKTSDEESKDKSTSSKHKLEEPILDDLVKEIQELNLNLKAMKLEGLSSQGSTSKPKKQPPRRGCMWCDSEEHERQDCDDFNEAYKK
ncbi:hypothetical protein L7F22_007153 [Adiantum nelumboides]|nr:hypothetical protein [Adiantum nelumboides]